jgi:glycerol-3-phosphate dehydrogenase
MTPPVEEGMDECDLLVIGGGINGAGIARDAAGRGLRVRLVEQDDFGGGTSSASSKLIHGGLRYLEHHQFRLVAESLAERDVLLRIAPHLVRPLQFILPHQPGMRPAWVMRIGLWLYDRLGGRGSLPRSRAIALEPGAYGAGLKPSLRRGYLYSDAWVDDARLVIANLRSAAESGAEVLPRTRFLAAMPAQGKWQVRLQGCDGGEHDCIAAALVNAAGPWAGKVGAALMETAVPLRLIKGSHIVVPRVHEGGHAYILQNPDGRIFFILPFERDFSLIGTTEVAVAQPEDGRGIDAQEVDYLLSSANRYLHRAVRKDDIRWTYSGVRSLYDDGHENATAVTRDYRLQVELREGAPLLQIYGGKLTTYRKLAEAALHKLRPWLSMKRAEWTHTSALPGGDFDPARRAEQLADLRARYAALPAEFLAALLDRHGSRGAEVLRDANALADLGRHFGAGLYEREVRYFVEREWARSAADVLWRRTKVGLHMSDAERSEFDAWFLQACTG